ncbi:hypothetical protein [Microbulbifer sp. SAOS-129_SWC]|uniref:hypothetical protein n=1 Tax=Microbulbifer sp. SAOS-129_SWC TaxID=3145235 RepID=UPI00321643FB
MKLLIEYFFSNSKHGRPDETALNRDRFDRFATALREAREVKPVKDYSVLDNHALNGPANRSIHAD